jgi:pyroglutamyl-peptidase
MYLVLQLMVHVGVSGIAKELTLEQQAHNHGYDKFDVSGCLPARGQCCCLADDRDGRGERCLVSGLRMGEVCEEVLNDECDAAAVVSYDPGR